MLEDLNNQAFWAGSGIANLGNYAQENDPNCNDELCNIQKVC